MRISIYLLSKNREVKEYVKENEECKIYELNIQDNDMISGYLIYQEKKNELEWITKINKSGWINSTRLSNDNLIKRGLILFKISSNVIPEDEPAIFAISFNGGVNILNNMYIDYNFGYDLASKLVSQNKIRNYASTDIHESIIKTDKNSSNYIPKNLIGENLILSTIDSITGYSDNENFVSGNKGLVLNYSGDFNKELIYMLEHLYLEYKEELSDEDVYNNLKKVKNVEEIEKLNEKLCEKINVIKEKFLERGRELELADLRDFDISVDYNSNVIGYKYTGLNKSKRIYSKIDKIEYFEQLSNYLLKKELDKLQVLAKLRRDKIVAIKENEDIDYSVYNSLIVRLSNIPKSKEQISMLISGNWYYVNKDYYSSLSERLESKVIREEDELEMFTFIDFDSNYKDELEYNKQLAYVNNGVLLDEKFFNISEYLSERKYSGYSKIEPCDVLLYSEKEEKYYFIHNKINSNTQGISHLSTQANISTSLLMDIEASDEFIKFINEQIDKQELSSVPKINELRNDQICIILAIIDKEYDKKLKTHFTILKLQALDNSISRLEQLGLEVKIKLIKDNTK